MRTLARPENFDEIVRRLRTVQPEHRARWGRMSAHQMICHLGDALSIALGTMPAAPARSALPRTVVKWLALYMPVHWPPGIPTVMEIDQEAGRGTTPRNFAEDVARVESLLRRVTEPGNACPDHPIFGRMSRNAWLRWGYLHADHHLRQFGV